MSPKFFALPVGFLIPVAIGGAAILPDAAPDLSAFSLTATLPVVYFPPEYNYTPSLSVKLRAPDGHADEFSQLSSDVVFQPLLDTGSTGLLLDALDLNITNATLARWPPGYEYLSSSTKLYRGAWIPFDLDFTDAFGEPVNVTSRIPVLVVNETLSCSEYQDAWESYCPPGNTKEHNFQPRGTTWWGIGFGREFDGQHQGVPGKNALLNIQSIGGVATVSNTNFRAGYSLTREGVVVGLTAGNTEGFRWTKLDLQSGTSGDPRDWKNVSGCISLNSGVCRPASILVDTGVTQSYFTTTDTSIKLVPYKNSSSVQVLPPGTNMLIRFGDGSEDPDSATVQYNFTVGDAGSLDAPAEVRTTVVSPDHDERINTGVLFYRDWESAFDAEGGWWGMKYVGSS